MRPWRDPRRWRDGLTRLAPYLSPLPEPNALATLDPWPPLPLDGWLETSATLHLWTQIVGKVRLVQSPWVNHSWHVTFYVTSSGLTTGPIPYGTRTFEIAFDFIRHRLEIQTSEGATGGFALEPRTVASFYAEVMRQLRALGLEVSIRRWPNEIPEPLPFDEDETHRAYDPEYANRYWRVLVQADRVLRGFTARFTGKVSPVHYFWGAPDLAVSRFSGRRAPTHPGGVPHLPDWVVRDAYSHEVSSCGFWAGGGPVPYAAFYAYIYPEPPGFPDARVEPPAYYSPDLREFILPYDVVRESDSPDERLLQFLQATYEAGAELASWDRQALERGEDPRVAARKP